MSVSAPHSESEEAAQRRARLRGIALMCAANVGFASIDTIAKLLVREMSSFQVAWARFFFAFIAAIVIVNVFGHPERMRSARPLLQVFRSTCLLSANVVMVYVLRFLQLDQTASIMFVVPFLVAGLAVPILGEKVGPRRWAAIAVGFIGVLIVMRPGSTGINPAAFLCLMSTVGVSLYQITTRVLSRSDSNYTTLFYTNMIGAIVLSAFVPFVWVTPSPMDAVLMAMMGLVATLGHFLLIAAHRLAPASIVAPFMYTQLVWMIFYGYVVFNDLPSEWTLAGASVVVASGLYLFYRERKVKGPGATISVDPVA